MKALLKNLTRRQKILLAIACLLIVVVVSGVILFKIAPDWLFGGALQEPRDWVEPRGLNIVDLVGWVPDSDLAGLVIQYTPGYGILRYVSGSRTGNTVTITATAYPRFYTDPSWNGSLFGCLGQAARLDELGSVAPETRLRVYTPGGEEITRQVDGYYYIPAGLTQPIRNPRESELANEPRYREAGWTSPRYAADGSLMLPANMGCELLISYKDYRELTLVFKAEVAPAVSVTVLSRQTFQLPVYVGPGYAGHLDPLRNQLAGTCSASPAAVSTMDVPSGTDYILFNYPPMPVDPYTMFPNNPLGNVDRPTGTTYRLRTPRGLSVDQVISFGLPLSAQWIDMDQAPGTQYLPYVSQRGAFEKLETLLPAGISYDPCMVAGNCSAALLTQICNTTTQANMIYLRVERIQAGLNRIPLQMSGPAWHSPTSASYPEGASEAAPLSIGLPDQAGVASVQSRHNIYLPNVIKTEAIQVVLEPDDPSGCSANGGCGWFTSDGRMVDYIVMP